MAINSSQYEERLKEIIKSIDRIERRLNETHPSKSKQRETFVNYTTIQQRTGWKGSRKMQWARDNGIVKYDKRKRKYILESIHPDYLKQPTP